MMTTLIINPLHSAYEWFLSFYASIPAVIQSLIAIWVLLFFIAAIIKIIFR